MQSSGFCPSIFNMDLPLRLIFLVVQYYALKFYTPTYKFYITNGVAIVINLLHYKSCRFAHSPISMLKTTQFSYLPKSVGDMKQVKSTHFDSLNGTELKYEQSKMIQNMSATQKATVR